MSASSMNLAELQRAMAAAVTMPLTPSEEMRAHAPDGRPMDQVAAAFIAPNTRLTPFERLEIYNRQYWFRVLGSLAEDFPALRAILGAYRFQALSVAYLTQHPSRSFTLRNLGAMLPAWLAAHPEFAARRHVLAVDIARIEWAFAEAFDNAENTPLTLEQIAVLDGDSRLALQPHLCLMQLNYAADDLVIALHSRDKRQATEAGIRHAADEDKPVRLPHLPRRPTWLAAHRLDNAVYYRRLAREEYATLCALRNGKPLAEALESGFAASRMPAARRGTAVQTWFATWAELGWITAPDLETLIGNP